MYAALRKVWAAFANRRPDGAGMVLRHVPRESTCAEIGVYKGEFSARILKVARPRRLHLIDPWHFEPSPEYAQSWYGGNHRRQPAKHGYGL